jgi:hypothetical protein
MHREGGCPSGNHFGDRKTGGEKLPTEPFHRLKGAVAGLGAVIDVALVEVAVVGVEAADVDSGQFAHLGVEGGGKVAAQNARAPHTNIQVEQCLDSESGLEGRLVELGRNRLGIDDHRKVHAGKGTDQV